jgi:hypothetical protein
MTIQTLSTPSGDKLVVMPMEEYEDLIDARRYEAAMRAIESGAAETLSSEQAEVYLAAPTPLAFWRERRGMSCAALAEAVSLPEPELMLIEAGKARGDISLYPRLAQALRVRIDDILPD